MEIEWISKLRTKKELSKILKTNLTTRNLVVLEKLEEETLAKLDEIWAGPGGEAPAAYAW